MAPLCCLRTILGEPESRSCGPIGCVRRSFESCRTLRSTAPQWGGRRFRSSVVACPLRWTSDRAWRSAALGEPSEGTRPSATARAGLDLPRLPAMGCALGDQIFPVLRGAGRQPWPRLEGVLRCCSREPRRRGRDLLGPLHCIDPSSPSVLEAGIAGRASLRFGSRAPGRSLGHSPAPRRDGLLLVFAQGRGSSPHEPCILGRLVGERDRWGGRTGRIQRTR